MRAKLCTICGSIAIQWDGHVHDPSLTSEDELEAGFCDKHEPEACYKETTCLEIGCYGEYKYDIIEY